MQKLFSLLLLLMCFGFSAFAQQFTVQGTVRDSDNDALIGASVVIKGATTGTVTDFDGKFSISAKPGDILVVTYLGYGTKEFEVKDQSMVEMVLSSNSQGIDEVVITAFGMESKSKSIGYSVQDIEGDEMSKAREPNIINSLNGKISGVTVVGTPSGVGSSSRITIRGERSLNINKNQPLFVVDGVPISNSFTGSSGNSNLEADYGNAAGMINPEDVESMTVLKGANASALYGSRANNGVIVITTKSGKSKNRIGVSFSSSTMYQSVLKLPEYQNKYGQGLNGEFSFLDGNGGGLRDGTDESWGPELNHIVTASDLDENGEIFGSPQTVGEIMVLPQFDSPRNVDGYRGGDVDFAPAGSIILPTPWDANPDNVKNFFETGHVFSNSIALDGGNEKGNFRVSYTRLDEKGIVPNTDQQRNTITLNSGYNFTNKLSSKVSFNYTNIQSDNRPNLSYGTENVMYLLNCWLDRGLDLNSLKDYWQVGGEGTQQFNYNYNYHDNPYFQLYENTNGQTLDRLFGNVSLKYDLTEWLYIQVRAGNDYTNELRDRRRAYSTQRFPFGSYRNEKITTSEFNFDGILGMNKVLGANWNFNALLGANTMHQKSIYLDVMAPQLLVPGVYSLNNSKVALQYYQFNTEKQINSLFGSAEFSFKDYWFISITGRNDVSSTLPSANNSFFYPSISSSLVISDFVEMPKWLSYVKVRAGIAQVGNDTDPYQTTQAYNAAGSFRDSYTYAESSILVNPDLKPEMSTSTEGGMDLRFVNDRVGISATYYNTISKNQILQVPITISSGYTAKILNAGKIKNNGIELSLNIIPVRLKDFEWSIDINWSKNNSEIIELTDEINNYVMATKYVTIEAREGGSMGDMYGYGFLRNPEGKMIFDEYGRPRQTKEKVLLGNYNPDWLSGINNSFRFKNIYATVLFDIRKGGSIYSHTQVVGREGGEIIETLEGRANGYDISLAENGVIGDGVVEVVNSEGVVTGYTPNTTKISSREWHTAYTNGRNLLEGAVYDASYTKLREVTIGYTFPNKVFKKTPIRDVNFSLVGRNLFLWSKVPHIDPETSALSGGTIIPGVEAMSIPSARSYGFNINLNF